MPYAISRRRRANLAALARGVANSAAGAYGLYRQTHARWKTFQSSRTKPRAPRANWTTQQHDARTVYRKRPMPRAKKRVWKKFTRKVNAVIDAGLGTRSVVLNDSGFATGGPTQQTFTLLHLYGIGTVVPTNYEVGVDDMNQVKGTIAAAVGNYEKVRFENAVLDVTFTNSGESALEVDVYEYQVKRRTSAANSMTTALVNAQADTGTLPGTVPISITDRGVTPFDIPMLAANEGVVIVSKRKYYTTPGNAFNYQLRDPKNHYMLSGDMGVGEWSKAGLTRGIFVLFKNIPGATGDAEITWGATRSYKYVLLENNAIGSGST